MAINLLPQDLQKQQSQKSRHVMISAISIGLLLVFSIGTAMLFYYRIVLNQDLDAATKKLNDVTTDLENQKVVEGTLQAIHLKLDKAQELTENNILLGDIVEEIRTLADDLVVINDVSVTNSSIFAVMGRTESLPNIAGYLDQFDNKLDRYQEMTVDEISFNQTDFQYEFTITFVYAHEDVVETP